MASSVSLFHLLAFWLAASTPAEDASGRPRRGQPAADVLASADLWGNPTFVGGLTNAGPTSHSVWGPGPVALDRAHHRLFIPAYGNGGYRAFQLDARGLPKDCSAMYVIGRASLYGRRSNPVLSEYELSFPGAITVFDTSTQRLFGINRFNNRILVSRAGPDEIERYPAANVAIGQRDFSSLR